MRIVEYKNEFQKEVIDLIVGIQRDELGVNITAEDQPDLKQIPVVYQKGKGNFWIAKEEDEIAGTIALIDIGNDEVALRKMFVQPKYRGKDKGIAQQLMDELIDWCRMKDIRAIYLGTIDIMKAAHRFYERNGFRRVTKAELPSHFPLMPVDNVFYKYTFKSS